MNKILSFICFLLVAVPCIVWADTVVLRDGKRYDGHVTSANEQEVTIKQLDGETHIIPRADIESVEFSNSETTRPSDSGGDTNFSGTSSEITVPAGTEIDIRTDDSINSTEATEGQTFTASVAQAVVSPGGQVMIPRGAPATLVLRSLSSGGTAGSANLVLDLDSVTVANRRYSVNSADIQKSNDRGIGKNRRTGEMVGGGAVLGTLLGAIAGGGKGAAIGAVAGAAAGGTTQVLTKGKEVKVPAETVLRFQLEDPLQLVGEQP